MSSGQPASLRAALNRIPLDRLRVLEPACGPAIYLRHFGSGSLGIDRSPGACEQARQNLSNSGGHASDSGSPMTEKQPTTVEELDLDQLGWSKHLSDRQPFQAAFLCDVVMHLQTPAAMLEEMAALLEPGAPVISVEWTLPAGPIAAFLARRLPGAKHVFETPKHLRNYHPDELVDLFTSQGYKLESTWIHSFEGHALAPLLRTAIAGFWPARTRLLRAPM